MRLVALALALLALAAWLPSAGCKPKHAAGRSAPSASAPGLPASALAPAPSASAGAVDLGGTAEADDKPDPKRYAWLADADENMPAAVDTLHARFPNPPGYERVAVEPGSFGEWLRTLPLAAEKTPVKTYKGATVYPGEDPYLAAVVAIDVGKIDLQQSPDVVLRLHAEWLWSSGERNMSYRGATGLDMPLSRWARGERVEAQGASVFWITKGKPAEIDHAEFRRYLDAVFSWANSISVAGQGESVEPNDIQPGDFFVQTSSPGHAVVVLDMAKKESGQRLALLGQTLNPAQNVFVLQPGPGTAWFSLRPGEPIVTAHTKEFAWEGLRRLGKPKPE